MAIDGDGRTIGEAFQDAVARYGDRPFLMTPPSAGALTIVTYRQAAETAAGFADALRAAGYGAGSRIAVLMGNRIDYFPLMLACNCIGVSVVPVNPDYRPAEIAYLLQDSAASLMITDAARAELAGAGAAESGRAPAIVLCEDFDGVFPRKPGTSLAGLPVTPRTEASLIYTSGTTGRPKGCRISHEYSLMVGARYCAMGGKAALREAVERIYNPLPLYHVNAMILSFFGALLSGNCQIVPGRFSKSAWWTDLAESGATVFHYLGVIIPALLSVPASARDAMHALRFGFGAGVEPELHAVFEDRFAVPLIECWGMTEMCRVFVASEEPRTIDSRAFGRPGPGREARVVDAGDCDVPAGTPGEFLLRHSAATPRKGFFCGYLNREAETEEAWRGGWFHTGDTVVQDETGLLSFVDRKKNVIRRSGENIAAAEVEDCLYRDPRVAQAAVIKAPDEMRDEEVFACIVVKPEVPADADLARALFDLCFENLAFYKPPGWILFVDSLPVTGTQKVLKHAIFADGADPRAQPGAHDFRSLKTR